MIKKIINKISNYRFAVMVSLTVLLVILFTGISVWIYVYSGAINIDLSRPGYEKVREDTVEKDQKSEFQTNGPINGEVVNDFNDRLDTLKNETNKMNNFSNNVMSDKALDINESE